MAEWIEKTLGEVTAFITKGIPPKYVDKENQDTVCVLNQKCNRNFEISYVESRLHNMSLKKVPSEKMLHAGDVLINSTGTGTAGRVAQIFEVPVPTTIDGHMILIRPTDEIDTLYYGYAIKGYQKKIESLAEGSTGQTEINRQRLQDEIIIRFPKDKHIQKSIGIFLLRIDEKIKNNEQINNNLEQQASVLVRQYCESLTSSVELGTVLSFENGFAFQSSSYHEKGKYRIITIKNVQDGRIDAQGAACIYDIPPHMKQGCFLTIGDVLLSLTGNVGRVGIVCENDLLLNQRVAKFIPKDIRTLPLLYFYFRLHSTKISLETISKGTAQQNLSPIETLKLEIPYETKQALELSNLLQPIFDTIYQKNIENIQLAEIRDSLLPKLMSGELDVSDIDI